LLELEADRDERMKELESLGHELSGLRSEIAATGENHSQATNQLTTALQEKENAMTKIKQHLEATKGAYENKLIDAQNTCKELEEKVGYLESELSQSKRNWELDDQQSKQSVQKLDAIIAEQRQKIVELQHHLEQANTQASKYKVDYEHTHSERDELSQTVNEHATSLARCHQDLNSLQEHVSSLESDLEAANNDLSQTKNKLLMLSKEREERENKLEKDMEATLSALNNARSEIADLTGQLSKARQINAAQEAAAANEQKATIQEEHEVVIQQLQAQIEESESRLARQLDAFNTIRGELTIVRERQLDREDEIEQRMQAQIDELQESLNEAYEKRKMAEDKLQQAGLSPVSERGFWVSDDGMSDSEGSEEVEDNNLAKEPIDRSPVLGRIPPLQKPRFSEFHHVPQCNGCLSEAFDV
jgi:chromosome segregation ATPase